MDFMRDKIFICTFSDNAIDIIRQNQLNIEINHTCISDCLDSDKRPQLLENIKSDIAASSAKRIVLHGPFTEIIPAAIDYRARDFAMERLNEAYEVAASVGAESMVVHTGWMPEIYFKSWQAEKGAAFWQKFMEDKPEDFKIHVENVLDDEPYMLLDFIERIDDSRISLCLDIGHAQAAGDNSLSICEWIKILGPHIGHFHLHNNYGDRDAHNAFGDGTMDFNEVLKTINEYCSPDVTLTIESHDAAGSVEWLKSNGYI